MISRQWKESARASITAALARTLEVRRLAAQARPAMVEQIGDRVSFPIVAFVQGVRQPANSKGPELFLAKHFEQAVREAKGIPVVFQHPTKTDAAGRVKFVSIRRPPFDRQTGVEVGEITRARIDKDGRIIFHVSVSLSALRKIGAAGRDVADAILASGMIEVSIGHVGRVAQVGGSFNGKPFFGIHTDVALDHLALLRVGHRGACSIADGCGAPRA